MKTITIIAKLNYNPAEFVKIEFDCNPVLWIRSFTKKICTAMSFCTKNVKYSKKI